MSLKNNKKLCALSPNQVYKLIDIKMMLILRDLNEEIKNRDGRVRQFFRINRKDLEQMNVNINQALVDFLEGNHLYIMQDYDIMSVRAEDYKDFQKLFDKHLGGAIL